MHRLTNAVLIFDEIQSLPRQCKVLFERAIRFLNVYGHSTVILCTATQPKLSSALSAVELMPNVDALYTQLKRVHFVSQLDRDRTYASAGKDIAQILKDKSVLAILNTKAAAWQVYEMREEVLLLRKAQAYTVNLYAQTYQRLMEQNAIVPLGACGAFALAEGWYSDEAGVII